MSHNYAKCPISKTGCIECPIYRGRHCFAVPTNGHARPFPVRNGDAEWQEGLKGFFTELDEQSSLLFDFEEEVM
jgi:hypothetical protein